MKLVRYEEAGITERGVETWFPRQCPGPFLVGSDSEKNSFRKISVHMVSH